ncbi:MAG: YidH family protein [bacterium]
MNKPDERFEVAPTASNHFAWLRTRLALERTLMAWARTSASLIGFGFTIVQFFQRVQSSSPPSVPVLLPDAPRNFGLALIASGILGLVVSLWQYHQGLHYLWSDDFRPVAGIGKERLTTPIVWVSIVLILVGLFAFFVVLFRWA